MVERILPPPDRFQLEAWAAIQRDLIAIARTWGSRAYRLGTTKAETELRVPDLFDPRGQAFVAEFNYRSIRSLTARTSVLTQQAILTGIREGQGVDDIAASLDLLLEGRVATVDTIARTEANRAANWARLSGWQKSGVVKAKECIATLDDRVREDHLEAHGEVVGLDQSFTRGAASGKNAPPWDPNCRCTIAPVTRLTETNDSGTEVPADREAAEEQAEENREAAIALAVPRHHIPGLISMEEAYAVDLRRSWRAGKARIIALVREHSLLG